MPTLLNDPVWRGLVELWQDHRPPAGWNPASPGEHRSSPLAPGSARFGPNPRPRQAPNSSACRPRREQQRGHPKACSIRGSPFLPLSRPSSASATAAKTCSSSLASPLRASPTTPPSGSSEIGGVRAGARESLGRPDAASEPARGSPPAHSRKE